MASRIILRHGIPFLRLNKNHTIGLPSISRIVFERDNGVFGKSPDTVTVHMNCECNLEYDENDSEFKVIEEFVGQDEPTIDSVPTLTRTETEVKKETKPQFKSSIPTYRFH